MICIREDKVLDSIRHVRQVPGSWFIFPPHLCCLTRRNTQEFVSFASPQQTGDLFTALKGEEEGSLRSVQVLLDK